MSFNWNDGPFEYVNKGEVLHKNVVCIRDGAYVTVKEAKTDIYITTVYADTGSSTTNQKEMHRFCVRKMINLSDISDEDLAERYRKLDAEFIETYNELTKRGYRFEYKGEEIEFILTDRIYKYQSVLKEL